MFTLTVDGSPEAVTLQDEKTFGEVMKRLSRQIDHKGRVITEIALNRQPLKEGKQFAYQDFPLNQVQSIELNTTEPAGLALEALESTGEHLNMLARTSRRTAELFRLGDELEGNESYSRLINGLRWLVKGLNALLGMMKIELDREIVEDKSPRYFQETLFVPLLDNMYSAQKSEDWIALADHLEYDLPEVLTQWGILVQALKRQIAVR